MSGFMKKQFMKKIICFCLGIAAFVPSLTASAASPTEAYVNQIAVDGSTETVYSRDVYEASRQINFLQSVFVSCLTRKHFGAIINLIIL